MLAVALGHVVRPDGADLLSAFVLALGVVDVKGKARSRPASSLEARERERLAVSSP